MPVTGPGKVSYFLVFAVIGLLAAIAGFAKTFFMPMAAGSFKAPVGIHIHGALAFTWIILFLVQTFLIHFRKYSIHIVLGTFGILVGLGLTVSLIPVGLFIVERALNSGEGSGSYSGFFGMITSGLLFLSLFAAGIIMRSKPSYHKRFMLLATIVILWPAWFRFRHYFPSVPRPEIWFALVLADSLIVIAWVWEKIRFGFIHPVMKYAGLFIILEQSIEVYAYDSPAWRAASKWLYDLFA